MVSGGGRLRPQEDSLSNPVDMVVGTPGRILQHIEEGNMVYGDIQYVVGVLQLTILKIQQ
jgi:superfamily II DNA/RNA helicase